MVGYKVPLSLGGADDVANLELPGRQVYVELCPQIALQLRESEPQPSSCGVTHASVLSTPA
ncbi:hypothetical protein [Streptomyces wuyuanensis]|uniref:hypothetical protein n=1 Tax=Streptomyces wuyuanensis TaxID=1196353 RepID=UPI003D714AC1